MIRKNVPVYQVDTGRQVRVSNHGEKLFYVVRTFKATLPDATVRHTTMAGWAVLFEVSPAADGTSMTIFLTGEEDVIVEFENHNHLEEHKEKWKGK